jgi:uncharacterized protein YyaL (SSP411 family)
VAIVGKDYKKHLSGFQSTYQPDVIYLGGKDEGNLPLLKHKLSQGETLIYVCQNKTCKRPVNEVAEAMELLKE